MTKHYFILSFVNDFSSIDSSVFLESILLYKRSTKCKDRTVFPPSTREKCIKSCSNYSMYFFGNPGTPNCIYNTGKCVCECSVLKSGSDKCKEVSPVNGNLYYKPGKFKDSVLSR